MSAIIWAKIEFQLILWENLPVWESDNIKCVNIYISNKLSISWKNYILYLHYRKEHQNITVVH